MKSNASKGPKRGWSKKGWYDKVIHTENIYALKTLPINRSRPQNLATDALGDSLVHQQWINQVDGIPTEIRNWLLNHHILLQPYLDWIWQFIFNITWFWKKIIQEFYSRNLIKLVRVLNLSAYRIPFKLCYCYTILLRHVRSWLTWYLNLITINAYSILTSNNCIQFFLICISTSYLFYVHGIYLYLSLCEVFSV